MWPGICDAESCCVAKVIEHGGDRHAFLEHYLSILYSSRDAKLTCFKEETVHCPPQDGTLCEAQPTLMPRDLDTIINAAGCSCGRSESEGSTGCVKGPPILYGGVEIKPSDNQQLYMCEEAAFAALKALLDFIIDDNFCGIVSPYLYVLRKHTIFAWHFEGCHVYTRDTLLQNQSKVWFRVPRKYVALFNYLVAKRFNLHVGHATCVNLTRVKGDVMDVSFQRSKIAVNMVVKDANELTYICHSNCDRGPRISEALKYVNELRFMGGLSDPQCSWSASAVISATEAAVGCGMLQCSHTGSGPVAELHEIKVEEMDLSKHVSCIVDEERSHTMLEGGAEDLLCRVKRSKPKGTSGRCVLECPACDKTYEGGKGRLARLLKHVSTMHKEQETLLLKEVHERYSVLQCKNVKKNRCPECNKLLAGNAFHVKMHLQSVHKFAISSFKREKREGGGRGKKKAVLRKNS